MGLDCEETGVSTDGRFFSREPGMTKVWDRWNRDGKMGPLTAWAKESPTRGLEEDYARSVGCHETEWSPNIATTAPNITIWE